jgi:DNA invertase Pin-like site-specific DNA recombinase
MWRNRAEFGSRSTEFEDLGIHLVTAVGDDTRRDGWMVVTIKLALAEQMRREVSYRTRRGMEGLALAGKSTGSRCLGYRSVKVREDDTSATTVIHEDEARVVVRIFTLRAAGLSLGGIARDTGLSRSSVQTILANRRYTGAVVWGERESHGGARDSRLKKRRTRSGGPLVTRQDEAQRIISDELFSACNPPAVVAA